MVESKMQELRRAYFSKLSRIFLRGAFCRHISKSDLALLKSFLFFGMSVRSGSVVSGASGRSSSKYRTKARSSEVDELLFGLNNKKSAVFKSTPETVQGNFFISSFIWCSKISQTNFVSDLFAKICKRHISSSARPKFGPKATSRPLWKRNFWV